MESLPFSVQFKVYISANLVSLIFLDSRVKIKKTHYMSKKEKEGDILGCAIRSTNGPYSGLSSGA